jgi:diacylglycerol kinase family enzyme
MLAGATEKLKKQMGWAAYVLSALRHLGDRPARVRLRADSGPPRRRWASGVIVGNVGSLQSNVRLLPGAVPDDGVLDVAVLAAWGWAGWPGLATDNAVRRCTIQSHVDLRKPQIGATPSALSAHPAIDPARM